MSNVSFPNAPERVLVIVTRRIGDVLLTTPLIRSLKQAWPQATVDVLVLRGTEGVLAGNPDIGEVIVGKARGRAYSDEKTLFLSNIGLGTQFAAVAAGVYEEAKKQKVGREIPSDWFLETVKK